MLEYIYKQGILELNLLHREHPINVVSWNSIMFYILKTNFISDKDNPKIYIAVSKLYKLPV